MPTTATPPTAGPGGARLMAALEALDLEPAQPWMDSEEVDDGGRLVQMPVDEKIEDAEISARECSALEAEAAKAGDCEQATFWRFQAHEEERHGARYRHAHRAATAATAVARSNGTPAPRRAESSGRPRARARTSTSSSSSRGDPDSSEGDGEPPPPGLTDARLCGCACGESIAHLAPQARFLNDAHRKHARREREPAPPLVPDRAKTCPGHGQVIDRDPDGDLVCVLCGLACGPVSARINGYDATAALMMKNGAGGGGRRAPTREWRTRPRRGFAQRNPVRGRWGAHR